MKIVSGKSHYNIITLCLILAGVLNAFPVKSQLINGSFEDVSGPALVGWEWTCFVQSYNNAPLGGGNYSIQVFSGNTQGCWPGYAYQLLPGIIPGVPYALTGWAFSQTSLAGIYFARKNNGIITLLDGDTTSSSSWVPLQVISSFTLSAGDTAAVLLSGGMTGGPVQGYGYFDLIELQPLTGIPTANQKELLVYPNPTYGREVLIFWKLQVFDATLTVYNSYGHQVTLREGISGNNTTWNPASVPTGIYFFKIIDKGKIISKGKVINCSSNDN